VYRQSSGRENNDVSAASNGPESKSPWDVIKTPLTYREARRKHTLASIQPSTPKSSTAPSTSNGPPPAKKMRKKSAYLADLGRQADQMFLGPVRGHPVQLDLMGQGKTSAQQVQLTVVNDKKMDKDNIDNNSLLRRS